MKGEKNKTRLKMMDDSMFKQSDNRNFFMSNGVIDITGGWHHDFNFNSDLEKSGYVLPPFYFLQFRKEVYERFKNACGLLGL